MGGKQSTPQVTATPVQHNGKNPVFRRTIKQPAKRVLKVNNNPVIMPSAPTLSPRSNNSPIIMPLVPTLPPLSNNIGNPTIANISSNSVISPKFTTYDISLPSVEWKGPICIGTTEGQRGFKQHLGECVNDSVQMLLLSADGIKENFQRLLFEKPIIREEIEIRINELKPNTLPKTVNYIYEYMKLFQRRFRRHYAGEILGKSFGSGKGQNAIPCSLYTKFMTNDLFNNINSSLKIKNTIESITKEKYKNGYAKNSHLILFFLVNFYKLTNLPLTELINEDSVSTFNIFSYFRDNKNINGMLFDSDDHATCMYRCNNVEYFYDNNIGVSKFPISKYFDIKTYVKNEFSYFNIDIKKIVFCLLIIEINGITRCWPGVQYLRIFYLFHPITLNLIVIEEFNAPITIDNTKIEVLERQIIDTIIPLTAKSMNGGRRRCNRRKTRKVAEA